jgi:hypothetical protein
MKTLWTLLLATAATPALAQPSTCPAGQPCPQMRQHHQQHMMMQGQPGTSKMSQPQPMRSQYGGSPTGQNPGMGGQYGESPTGQYTGMSGLYGQSQQGAQACPRVTPNPPQIGTTPGSETFSSWYQGTYSQPQPVSEESGMGPSNQYGQPVSEGDMMTPEDQAVSENIARPGAVTEPATDPWTGEPISEEPVAQEPQKAEPALRLRTLQRQDSELLRTTPPMGDGAMGGPIGQPISEQPGMMTCPTRPVAEQAPAPQQPIIVMPCAPRAAESPGYTDVAEGSWSSPAITYVSEQNILVGYPDNTFRPNQNVTRAEFATVLVKAMDMQDTAPVSSAAPFRDTSGHWAQKQIQTVNSLGLMTGYPDNTFRPNQPITRAEAMTTVVKGLRAEQAVSEEEATNILQPYVDADEVPDWAETPVATSVQMGLLQGEPVNGSQAIRPNQPMTRAELASFVMNTQQRLGMIEPETVVVVEPVAEQPPLAGQTELVSPPAVPVTFQQTLNPRNAIPGQYFHVVLENPIAINGQTYPAGSVMTGQVLGVQRPQADSPGGVRMAFTGLVAPDGRLVAFSQPNDVSTNIALAIPPEQQGNFLSRAVQAPFNWGGDLLSATGSGLQTVGETSGEMVRGVGSGFGSMAELQPRRGFEQWGQAATVPFRGTTGQPVAAGDVVSVPTAQGNVLVDAEGKPISRIRRGETVPLTFGSNPCPTTTPEPLQ